MHCSLGQHLELEAYAATACGIVAVWSHQSDVNMAADELYNSFRNNFVQPGASNSSPLT